MKYCNFFLHDTQVTDKISRPGFFFGVGWGGGCLFICCFTSLKNFSHIWDVTIASEGLQNLGLCSVSLSREVSLSCHTCCDTEPRFSRSHPKDRPMKSPFTTHKGKRKTYSNPDPHGTKVGRLLRYASRRWGPNVFLPGHSRVISTWPSNKAISMRVIKVTSIFIQTHTCISLKKEHEVTKYYMGWFSLK
jgi:hypothetical protein